VKPWPLRLVHIIEHEEVANNSKKILLTRQSVTVELISTVIAIESEIMVIVCCGRLKVFIFIMHFLFWCAGICPNNTFPTHFRGDWYSIDQGVELYTTITPEKLSNRVIESSSCADLRIMPGTQDAQGNYGADVLIKNT
jgi:hypothetical protein